MNGKSAKARQIIVDLNESMEDDGNRQNVMDEFVGGTVDNFDLNQMQEASFCEHPSFIITQGKTHGMNDHCILETEGDIRETDNSMMDVKSNKSGMTNNGRRSRKDRSAMRGTKSKGKLVDLQLVKDGD